MPVPQKAFGVWCSPVAVSVQALEELRHPCVSCVSTHAGAIGQLPARSGQGQGSGSETRACERRVAGWAGSAREGDEPARSDDWLMPELPHVYELEAHPLDAGVQTRRDPLSAARHAPGRGLHKMPYVDAVQEREHTLFRLPCRHSYAAVRGQLRELSLGEGLAGFDAADPEPYEPFSAGGSARRGGVRRLPQGRGHGTVYGAID